MTTLSASPGNANGDDGMLGVNSTVAEVQWFCDNTNICGLPAFVIGVAGILFFLISCIVWCYIYRTRLYLKNHHTTEEDNAGKELTKVISDNPTLYEEAIEYQIETTRRYEEDPTQKLCTQAKAYDEYENVRSTDVANGDRKKIKEKLCTPTKACDEYDYIRADVTNGGTTILKEKLCTQTKAYDEYENVRSTDVANGDRKKIKEKLCTPTKACDEYDYVRADFTNGGTTILKEIPTEDTSMLSSTGNEMRTHSDLKKTRYHDNLKKCTPKSDLGSLGNTPIASGDEKINNPSSVKGQKVNDTKTYPQLLQELTRELKQKVKSEDVDCSEQYNNDNALSIEDPDNRMLVHDKELSENLEDVHSDRTRDFEGYERMEGPLEIPKTQEDIQGTYYEEPFNLDYENVDTSGNRGSSDSSNSEELCTKVSAEVHIYKPKVVQMHITNHFYDQKNATGAN